MDIRNNSAGIYIILLSVTFAGIASCNAPRTDQETAELLENVEKTYKNLEQFSLKAQNETKISIGRRNQITRYSVTYKAVPPDRIRMEVRQQSTDITYVSNEETSWTYLTASNQYTRKSESSNRVSNEGSTQTGMSAHQKYANFASQLTAPYESITKNLEHARITGETNITVDSVSRPVYKVEAHYEESSESDSTTYWIDKEHHLVLKHREQYDITTDRYDEPVRVEEVLQLSHFDLAPEFTEKTFTYEPPSNARRVEKLTPPKKGQSRNNRTLTGQEATDFTLSSLERGQISLSEYRGEVVLMDFWASWCGPCRRAHPHIQELYDEYKDQGLVVLGINNESRRIAKDYMERNNYTFTTLLDTTEKVFSQYGVNALPNVIIINRKGTISSHMLGYRPKGQVKNALQKAGLEIE